MKRIDKRLTNDMLGLLVDMIGKRFDGYQCDEFHFRPAVHQAVYFKVDGKQYAAENAICTLDYFGSNEEVGVLSVKEWNDECESRVMDGIQVCTPIGQIIEDIKVVNDAYQMIANGDATYEILFTKAIVFCFDGRQVVFEKDIWLSEDIFIYRGAHAVEKIANMEVDMPENYDDVEFISNRDIESLADDHRVAEKERPMT